MDLDLQLTRTGDRPIVEQIREGLARAIEAGALAEGARLPSTREMAQRFDLNRQTAVEAYRRLEADGLIQQRRGAGAYVLPRAARQARHAASALPQEPLARASRVGSRALRSFERRDAARAELPHGAPDALDLAGLVPHERDYPSAAFGECLSRVLAERGGAALGYGPAAGDPALREALAARLARRGLDVDASGILVVGGAQQGLDLLFRALLDPGDAVIVESPTYHLCLDLLAFHQAELLPVPLMAHGREGLASLDMDRLRDHLKRARPGLAYVMPTAHNPTGLTLDLETRRMLASDLASAGVTLIEDDYEADMLHEGEPLPPVATLPEAGGVVYLGTLSKALFPGLRIGWLAGNRDVLARVARVKRLSDLSGSVLLQAVAAELMTSGTYDEHLREATRRTGAHVRRLVEALRAQLPPEATVTVPRGGHVLWLEAPAASGREIAERAAARGVLVTPGEAFLPEQGHPAAVRVSIARVAGEDIERAAGLLASAVREAIDSNAGRMVRPGQDLETPVRV